jgi:outer membrane protein OmpA-like peptidoglycan-associated protein
VTIVTRKHIGAVLAWLTLTAGARAATEPDCKLGQRYLHLAHERLAAEEGGEAESLLRQAIDACPSYDAYQALGELQAQSPRRTDQAHAVDAFVAAHALAPTAQARARTLFKYASLLSRDGDPQNAYPLIRDAQRIDPTNDDIARLSTQIDRQVRNPTQQHIVRGMWNSLYQPLQPASMVATAASSSPGPSINVPIDFISGTDQVDDESRANVDLMAKALADPAHAGQRFLFVGHAALPGDEPQNVALSKRRAEAIYTRVIALEPSLRGRIDCTGRGSSEPIDAGQDERASKANGRLQVLLN